MAEINELLKHDKEDSKEVKKYIKEAMDLSDQFTRLKKESDTIKDPKKLEKIANKMEEIGEKMKKLRKKIDTLPKATPVAKPAPKPAAKEWLQILQDLISRNESYIRGLFLTDDKFMKVMQGVLYMLRNQAEFKLDMPMEKWDQLFNEHQDKLFRFLVEGVIKELKGNNMW